MRSREGWHGRAEPSGGCGWLTAEDSEGVEGADESSKELQAVGAARAERRQEVVQRRGGLAPEQLLGLRAEPDRLLSLGRGGVGSSSFGSRGGGSGLHVVPMSGRITTERSDCDIHEGSWGGRTARFSAFRLSAAQHPGLGCIAIVPSGTATTLSTTSR